MTRQLPIVEIEKTLFFVDVLHEELRQKGNTDNRISFNAFDQEGDGYTFLYDRERKNTPDPEELNDLIENKDRFVWITLPALMELDPVGIALKYDIPLHVLCPEIEQKPLQQWEEDESDDYGCY